MNIIFDRRCSSNIDGDDDDDDDNDNNNDNNRAQRQVASPDFANNLMRQ